MVTASGSDSASHRIRAVRQSVGVGLVRQRERGGLVDDHSDPVGVPWGDSGGREQQGVRLALLAKAVVAQRSWRMEDLQSLWALILRVGQRSLRTACQED